MITKARMGNGEKIADAIKTNNNRFHKYTRNKRSVERLSSPYVVGRGSWWQRLLRSRRCLPLSVLAGATTGNMPETGKSVLEAESEKLMKQRTRVEQVKKEKEENRAAKQ